MIIRECYHFLSSNAAGLWHETYKCLDGDNYIHPIQRGMVLLRVEKQKKRAFYWIYNYNDAVAFNIFVGQTMHGECHEIIITNGCRMFYDIDLILDICNQDDFAEHYGFEVSDINKDHVMSEISERVAYVFKEAMIISLEEHGNDRDDELRGIDWLYTTRNRQSGDIYKISIHLITNIFTSLRACAAIASDIKLNILNENVDHLGITESIASKLSDAIDEQPYHNHGSLGLPHGTKTVNGINYTSRICKDFGISDQSYFITVSDQHSLNVNINGYDIAESSLCMNDADPDFVNAALKHIRNIKDYDPRVFDINASVVKHSIIYMRRYSPSWCSICNRTHDNDNTLVIIFNSDVGIASWKCNHASMKPIIFYTSEDTSIDDDDIEAFVCKYAAPKKLIDAFTEPNIKQVKLAISQQDWHQEATSQDDDDISIFARKHATLKKLINEIEEPAQNIKRSPYARKPMINCSKPLPPKRIDISKVDPFDEGY